MRGIAPARARPMAVAVVASALLLPALGAGQAAAAGSPKTAPMPTAMLPATSAAAQPALGEATARLIVAFEEDASETTRRRLHRLAGGTDIVGAPAIDADVVTVTDAAAAIDTYERSADVRYAEVDGVVRALATPIDPGYVEQWNLHPAGPANPASLNWEPVWSSRAPLGDDVRVAVVDSGYRAGGADPPANVTTNAGWDFVNGDANPDDENGHGTHVIGTIAQRTNNDKGVAGVAPDAEIVPIKVLDRSGSGAISTAIRGLQHATAIGARVINLSLGGPYSRAFCDAVAAASATAVVVAASGNDSTPSGMAPVSWPAACPGATAVGGLRQDGTRAPYSNGGCALSLAAPGGDTGHRKADGSPFAILQETVSTEGRFDFFYDAGTSMAAAHVSGAAAVLLSQPSRPSVGTVVAALRATARDVETAGPDARTGVGAADLARALQAIDGGTIGGPPTRTGYWLVASDGGIFSYGDAAFHGSTGGIRLNKPIVGMAPTPTGDGYWLVASDGGIFSYGDAAFHGSTGALKLNRPIVGMVPTPTGDGYWLVASDGGIFSFGDAAFHGSAGGIRLDAPIVTIKATASGGGYWLVGSDGGIFAFGDAPYLGSTGGIVLNRPITGMAVTLSGQGYWLTASDGGIFAFGDAAFHGSTGARALNSPIVGMSPTCRGGGYWLVAADGGLFAFGDAPFAGSAGALPLTKPVIGMARAIDLR